MSITKALALTLVLLPATAAAQETLDGTWGAEFRSSTVHLDLRMDQTRGFSNYGRTLAIADLTNLRRDGRVVTFELRRPAGTFRFEGAGETRASGRYTFLPDASFRRALQSAGLGDLTVRRMATLAMHDVGLDDVKYMQGSVRGGFSTAELIRMLDHGAGPEFVREIHGAGFEGLTSEELTRTRDHGVNADFVRELSASGLKGLSLSEYVRLRDHGVDGDFAYGFRELGYKSITADQLIRLRDHGVTATYARRQNREENRLLAPDELARRRSRGHR